jgi:hypothetical protein
MFKCLNVEAFPQVQFAPHLFQNYLFFDSMMRSGGIQIRSRICFYRDQVGYKLEVEFVFTVNEEKK